MIVLFCGYLLMCICQVCGTPGKYVVRVDETSGQSYSVFPTYLYKNGYVTLSILCAMSHTEIPGGLWQGRVGLKWIFKKVDCMENMYNVDMDPELDLILSKLTFNDNDQPGSAAQRLERSRQVYGTYHTSDVTNNTSSLVTPTDDSQSSKNNHINRNRHGIKEDSNQRRIIFQASSQIREYSCGNQNIIIPLDESSFGYFIANIKTTTNTTDPDVSITPMNFTAYGDEKSSPHRVVSAWEDGMYQFAFAITPTNLTPQFQAKVYMEMQNPYGLLSAIDWPILPFSVVSSLLYLVLATVWLVVWARSQAHSKPIHVVLGIIAVAGAIGTTLTFVQYATLNSEGRGVMAIIWFTRVLNCIQTSLIAMLLMVVAVGYGITSPKLSCSIIGVMYILSGILFTADLFWYVLTDEQLQLQYSIPIPTKITLVMKVGIKILIAGWVMLASIATYKHLKVGQHTTKLKVFSAFMGFCTMSFVVCTVMFILAMPWMQKCRDIWRIEWLFVGMPNIVNFLLLIMLMVLWRPQDFAQTYAFTPLGDMENITSYFRKSATSPLKISNFFIFHVTICIIFHFRHYTDKNREKIMRKRQKIFPK